MTRALVTGAGTRLGQAMAIYLAGRGYDVAVHYASSADGARHTVQKIEEAGGKAVALKANLLKEEETQALMPAAIDALGGPITCLVNNASIFQNDSVHTGTRESWDRHIESNLRAPFVLIQAMATQDLENATDENGEPISTGLVVNMVDQRVRKLTPEFASYTIAKMGLWALTQTMAQGLAPVIRVNGIGPGPTLQGPAQSAEQFAKQRQATILRRGVNLNDITGALGYFLDSPAVTGQMLAVDGGQHLGWETPDIVGLE